MTNPINSNEVPPVLMKRSNRPCFLRIGLAVAVVVFVVAKVWQHEHAQNLPLTMFLLSGEEGARFSFSATAVTGESMNVTSRLDKQKQKVLATKYEVISCELERLDGAGKLTLEIIVGTNLVSTAELAKDKRVAELKKDGWNYKEF